MSEPNPEDVDPVGDAEGVYERDADGNLQPTGWQVIEYQDEYKKVRPYPIPTGDFQQFESMGEDVDMEELADILADKFETPDRSADEWKDTDPKMFMECMNLLVELATGETPSTEFHEEVQSELEGHDAPGNSIA